MRQPESVQRSPNRGAVDRDATGLGQIQHKLIKCDLALRANTGLDPIRHACQFPMSTAIALRAFPVRNSTCQAP